MEKFKYLAKIKEIYAGGGNIIKHLKDIGGNTSNSLEDILISYDFQSGTYIENYVKDSGFKDKYCKTLSEIIKDLGDFNSIVEVGVGEATTLYSLLKNLNTLPSDILGFDLSWSRLKFAKQFLADHQVNNVKLFTANLFEVPLLDNSIDIVYTSHSIEPNGGMEKEALMELYRITKKYLILLEPSFEFANEEAKARMIDNGYVKNLFATAKELGYKIIEHKLYEHSINPLNPTGLIIIEKTNNSNLNTADLICPISFTRLQKYNESFMYSSDSFLVYPILEDIPCLLKENSILATHLLTDYEDFKEQKNLKY